MTGTLKKEGNKWYVEYWYERTSSHAKHPNQTRLPLHLSLNKILIHLDKN